VETLFLFHLGAAYPRMEMWASQRADSALGCRILKFARFLERRRNPRSLKYMREMAEQSFPEFRSSKLIEIDAGRRLPSMDLKGVKKIVMLWPDSNGTGWNEIEREVLAGNHSNQEVFVLNGRRRLFPFTMKIWRQFRVRRFLEKTLVAEFGIAIVFLLTSPALMLIDLARGRR
jgi:hypothetical protein